MRDGSNLDRPSHSPKVDASGAKVRFGNNATFASLRRQRRQRPRINLTSSQQTCSAPHLPSSLFALHASPVIPSLGLSLQLNTSRRLFGSPWLVLFHLLSVSLIDSRTTTFTTFLRSCAAASLSLNNPLLKLPHVLPFSISFVSLSSPTFRISLLLRTTGRASLPTGILASSPLC